MEAMRAKVIRVGRHRDHLVAEVSAVSKARLRGEPLATINLRVILKEVPGELEEETHRRAKDEAPRFLDIG